MIPSFHQCCLCPVPGGPLKPTSCGRFAHISCANWLPKCYFPGLETDKVPLTVHGVDETEVRKEAA